MMHSTVAVWLIFLALPIAGCKKDENANLFCVEVTEDDTGTAGVSSMPVQKSISPEKLQSLVLDRLHAIRKKTSKKSSPVFFLEYRCNGIKQGNTIPTKFMYDGERLALAILIDETWIPACWGDWESQKKWLRESAYTIKNCTTFLKRAEEIGLADPNRIDKTTSDPEVLLPRSHEANKATAELKVLSETLNADDTTRIGELLKAGR